VKLRSIIFWLHLVAGVVAGIVILVMCATGVVLAFEKEIIAWAERDVRRVEVPAGAPRLPLDELLARVRTNAPDLKPSSVVVHSAPTVAVHVSANRTNAVYVNPYTGTVLPQGAAGTRAFMQTMIEWHRYLAQRDGQRPLGKAITGACNVAFCFLAVSGLFLWWPRQWTKNTVRAVTVFGRALRGKARDWNWHNVIGFWCAPVLIVVTLSAMPISYRTVTDWIYKLTRTAPPGAAPTVKVSEAAGAAPLPYETLLAHVQKSAPAWHTITLRLGNPAQGVSFAVKQRSPRFVTAQFTVDPYNGALLRAETYADYNLGRRIRTWMRFLHTGEALGPIGQFVAGVASLGGVVLVYTGFALAIRRLLRSRGSGTKVSPPNLDPTANR
jgi:uncharacterized iron-regulated membrane protein